MIDLDRPTTLLSLTDAARLTRISRSTIRRAVADGSLPAYRVGNRYRVRVTDLEAWIDAARIDPKAARPQPPQLRRKAAVQ